jgi:hypothetical protein
VLELIRASHVAVNHGGADKTFAFLAERHVGIPFRDVKSFVTHCETCVAYNKRPTRGPTAGFLPMRTVPSPWAHIQMDLVDLRNLAGSNDKFEYILTCVDHFSR